MSRTITVVGAVIMHEDRILCAQRSFQSSLPGFWEFPGGKVEEDETPRQALERELEEELNISVNVGDEITTAAHKYEFGTVILTTFYCELLSEEVTLTEHESVVWLAPNELRTLEWAPADLPTISAIEGRFLSE
ncbi:MAG: (deoxy)nucleoside triphosphate pyrophosphohydrolase [Microbacteriaceae bacterium]|nr:(deoxy)nucleoside triphosphate pyrophosphohydrolase [Microbacteriaceae bacterium]